LIASDDLEMGGVLKAAPIDRAAVEFVRAGGDLCLICHEEDNIQRAFETMVGEAERDPKFRRRVLESAKRVASFKRKSARLLRPTSSPKQENFERLSRQLWEFSEQIRLQKLASAAGAGANG